VVDFTQMSEARRKEQEEEDKVYSRAKGRRVAELHTFNTSMGFVMYALCDDGTIWSRSPFAQDGNTGWDAVPPIPGSWADIQEKMFAEVPPMPVHPIEDLLDKDGIPILF
jgi:hypothetical protein